MLMLQIQPLGLASIVLGGSLFLFMLYFALMSKQEEEPLATKRALTLAFWVPIPFLIAGFTEFAYQSEVCIILISVTILAPLFLLIPQNRGLELDAPLPNKRIDERDIMFSRNLLEPGTDRFDDYYGQNPQRKILDDKFRTYPGLLQKGATYNDPITASAALSSFKTVAAFHKLLDDEELPPNPQPFDPTEITKYIKRWLKDLGAVSVGVTELKDYHLYSTIGRGDKYGDPVDLNHQYAIALTVEMDKYLLDRAPKGPTVMESAQQYLNSGTIAVQLAEFIRQLGYSTRAHIDGSYRVVCPLVARDAGLGEIGRMGLLITPELGPRVRLAVITTDLPLVTDARKQDPTVIDFCTKCKKCADVCPSNAISFDDREKIEGAMRWKIDSEACFTLWCKIGTDCARCMSVCPYSHPNTFLHNMVRFGLKRSGLFRTLALKLDDFFYGRKPMSLDVPDWIKNVGEKK